MEKLIQQDSNAQTKILNAALSCFGTNGYKKTSMQDIANQSKFSKALLFHYFESKKGLYLHVLEYANTISSDGIMTHIDENSNDLFVLLKQIQQAKFGMYNLYPNLFKFLESAYFESDPEIIHETHKLQDTLLNNRLKSLLSQIDTSKFREGMSLEMVMNLITWVTKGYVDSIQGKNPIFTLESIKGYDLYFDFIKKAILKED